MDAAEDPLVDLQTRIAFQEDALQALADALAAQERRIEHLQATLARLTRRLDGLVDGDPAPDESGERPPHY